MTRLAPTTEDDDVTLFVRNTYTPLYRCAMSRVKHDALAQDLVQETYRKLLTALQKAPGEKNRILKIEYAITVLINSVRDHYRKVKSERAKKESYGLISATRVGADPGKTVSEDDNRARFLMSLKRRQQQVLLLTEAGYTPAEIAEILELAEGTVNNILTIIRKRLRD